MLKIIRALYYCSFSKKVRGERENFLMTKQLPLGYENYQNLLKNANNFKLQSNASIPLFCLCLPFVMGTKLFVIVTSPG